jgi:hypothetical protein
MYNRCMKRKRCCICKRVRLIKFFNKRTKSNDGLQIHCKDCNRERSHAYYLRHFDKHKQEILARNRRVRREQSARAFSYLSHHPCVDCGEDDPVVLEFDHVRGKKLLAVCSMIRAGYSWQKIETEIDKCEVRCANCHRRKTAIERGYYSWKPLEARS